ncbi:MAG: hypothetical protein R3F56_17000 [Planctomycetota bacterium]
MLLVTRLRAWSVRGVLAQGLLACVVVVGPALPAQVGAGEIGFMLGSNGATFGTTCPRTFSCTYLAADLARGLPADFTVRGVPNQPFAIALWIDQPHQCLGLPGFHNSLFAASVVLPFAGTLTQPDRILACPGGLETIRVPIPAALPVGTALTMQALAYSYWNGGQVPTFTMALRATIR